MHVGFPIYRLNTYAQIHIHFLNNRLGTKRQMDTTEDKDGILYEPGPLPLGRFTMERLIAEGVSGVRHTPKLRWVGEGPEKSFLLLLNS